MENVDPCLKINTNMEIQPRVKYCANHKVCLGLGTVTQPVIQGLMFDQIRDTKYREKKIIRYPKR